MTSIIDKIGQLPDDTLIDFRYIDRAENSGNSDVWQIADLKRLASDHERLLAAAKEVAQSVEAEAVFDLSELSAAIAECEKE